LTLTPKCVRLDTINVTQYGTAICLTITDSWDVTPCGWVCGYKHFRVPVFLHFHCGPKISAIRTNSLNALKMEAVICQMLAVLSSQH